MSLGWPVTLQYGDGHLQDVLVPVSEAHLERRIPTTAASNASS